MEWKSSLQEPRAWLGALGIALAGLQLTVLEFSKAPNLMSLSILVWLAIASLIWDKRDELKFHSSVFSSVFGATLIIFVLIRSLSPVGYHLTVSPLICGVGLALMASGFKGLSSYWKELTILALLASSSILTGILNAINLPQLTAKFSNGSLWTAGFKSYREGVSIILPTGRVEVYGSCSGVESILLMFFVGVLFLFIIPIKRIQQVICLSVAVFIGFITNAIRVSIMAVLVASSQREAFEYWHGDDGSLIFALISVLIFGVFCWFAYVRSLTLTSEIDEDFLIDEE
ncbi:cyanoexosortase A [Crocosphaera sp. UHCC 0190]|uniref:cyanoexosortase A n=1 Tax=Crocosphaera sp. UHCC 0190 TaxID=3110246 RepID=UPI002B1F8CA0|nr:cyanoexosortase A [Crocosphaera sp. UHCC 0190]MEA5508851.1 cyanoexosortase A [Crocosphaera sp. UHCC 0190]